MTTNDNQSHGIVNFQNKPRCGAKSRSGKPCKNLPAKGKKRCRFHGGADGIGAPKGNKNAWKHGGRSRAAIENRKQINRVLREAREFIKQMEADRLAKQTDLTRCRVKDHAGSKPDRDDSASAPPVNTDG